ncbi:hypothetical protein [Oceanivirga miroungae]|uniref:Uncharacterized protein n=1 Tax=Oceanivirga miroungae TaxID=1130046 RepID=A0A6I8M891_9FUSO|nr:hypothetical protein [Oceanivirga miroungae]VWL85671.1 hypothetical protein OMES3154_00955 [Oceanivirga miroungae]
MYKISINSIYRYENNEIEKIEKDYLANLLDDTYISDEIDLRFGKNFIEVIGKKNAYYIKRYELDKITRARLEVNSNLLETKIKTNKFKENNGVYMILASEYTTDNDKILDVKINIKIKEI